MKKSKAPCSGTTVMAVQAAPGWLHFRRQGVYRETESRAWHSWEELLLSVTVETAPPTGALQSLMAELRQVVEALGGGELSFSLLFLWLFAESGYPFDCWLTSFP